MTITKLNGIKIKAVNTTTVVFTQVFFHRLSLLCSKAVIAMGEYHPIRMDTKELRERFNEFYRFMAEQLQDIYEYNFEPDFMTGLKIESLDIIEGSIHVSIEYTWDLKKVRFGLKVMNEGSPYSTKWPEQRAKLKLIEDKTFVERLSYV